ncbi:hypothetical protein ONZ43_g7204 [Nemania bipapillata]|uniref:Uncharacterized protein n=1 Tax=Nemania bipapillata TaxID=110536 RepID=A0ACC2HT60_9PEZI|nr:hypothetical protein ONZ43_g7204 [Nemania bipapillata]
MRRLVEDLMWRDFERTETTRRDLYTEADAILNRAYEVRGGDMEEEQGLAHIERSPPRSAGHHHRHHHHQPLYDEDGVFGDGVGEEEEGRRRQAPRGQKREREYDITEDVDEDGQQVYTMHTNKRPRPAAARAPTLRGEEKV